MMGHSPLTVRDAVPRPKCVPQVIVRKSLVPTKMPRDPIGQRATEN